MTSSGEHSKKIATTTGIREWLPALGVSFATALLVISPFFFLGNASGHDFGFHAASWLDVAGQGEEGIFFPRWAGGGNHRFRGARFVFLPPPSVCLGADVGM